MQPRIRRRALSSGNKVVAVSKKYDQVNAPMAVPPEVALVKSEPYAPSPSDLTARTLSRQSSSSDLSSEISPEIMVWTEEMDMEADSQDDSDASSDVDVDMNDEEVLHPSDAIHSSNELAAPDSLTSALSVMSDLSDISSLPSTESSKATTPAEPATSRDDEEHAEDESTQKITRQPSSYRHDVDPLAFNVRPKSSIPSHLTSRQYANECIAAAESSRLNPYALHPEEYSIFRHHISHAQVTTYLNIRNGILRLWLAQPQICLSRQAAIGCANARWFDAANVCYDWLVRCGYINYGCVQIPDISAGNSTDDSQLKKPKVIAVIGAGISGLGCARQLRGLFKQYADIFRERGEAPPRVVVLEGRSRVGGRVYSREFKTKMHHSQPVFGPRRCTAEMGGMIVTGFERGNPMNILIRGQLGLAYHALTPDTTIYDSNGKPVDLARDQLVENLYNDCLDRVSEYKHKPMPSKLIEGNRELIDEGRDSPGDGSKTIMQAEVAFAALPNAPSVSQQNVPEQVNMVPVSSDKLTGRVHTQPGVHTTLKASEKARQMGWDIKHGAPWNDDINSGTVADDSGATLGSVLDYIISRYKDIVDLTAQDHRLLNWHIANLEYSNATNLHNLSLPLWDIDAGNEWEGHHTMVVGGYQSVARGLLQCPDALDIKTKFPVRCIRYNSANFEGAAVVECEDGSEVEADVIVNTIPLGVLKQESIVFDPPLPRWKTDAISRLGFGILNKVVLVYDKVFWDSSRHIFGVLRDASNRHSTMQKDYGQNRGRFFQWFNTSPTTGLPCLIALMAGDAGFETEHSSNESLVEEATEILRSVFGADVPYPVEAIVTRWGSDRFARGSYSSAAPEMHVDDYDTMARPIGNLYFAGEHTIGSHPATVHGAYLSGLRAASEILEGLIGSIQVPTPLILPKDSLLLHKRKQFILDPKQARLDAYESEVSEHIRSNIGERPSEPVRAATNAYILYSKANLDKAKELCEASRKLAGKSRSTANDARMMTSRMWKDATQDVRRPFEEQASENKRAYSEAMRQYSDALEIYDQQAIALRAAYEKEHPLTEAFSGTSPGGRGAQKYRRSRYVSNYVSRNSDAE